MATQKDETSSVVDVYQKVLDLENGLSIWKVSVNRLREQDRNARTMTAGKFARLVENVKKDQRLESLPLCVPTTAPGGREEMSIISGHHRVRAAVAAGLASLYVLAFNEAIPKARIIAKQLAHNAITGVDDPSLLSELYQEIDDVQARIESALTEQELNTAIRKVAFQEIGYALDFELLCIAFLPHEKEKFDLVIKNIADQASVMVAPMSEFPGFRKAMIAVGRSENIRNVTGMLTRMAELASERLAEIAAEKKPETALAESK